MSPDSLGHLPVGKLIEGSDSFIEHSNSYIRSIKRMYKIFRTMGNTDNSSHGKAHNVVPRIEFIAPD